MKADIAKLAYDGEWAPLLALLRERPDLANCASEPKGYTPLHQAAWHGASLSIIGQLLALGADPTLRTHSTQQTPKQIAAERHPDRGDIAFLLAERRRTLAQLMRKIAVDTPALFGPYDGNQVLFDRLLDCFGFDACFEAEGDLDVDERLSAALLAITGRATGATRFDLCGPSDPEFWSNRFKPLLHSLASRASRIPIERHWAVVPDLFDPAPQQWGLRGDPFLWMEMRQVLCHVPLPAQPEAIEPIIHSAFLTLTGQTLDARSHVRVQRLARGGMSSGIVSGAFWAETFIPLIRKRAEWLVESWRNG